MFIESTGMVCSVGLSAKAACAAMRAGIANFQELPYIDNQGEPIIGAMVPGLAPNLKRGERLGELLAMAVVDCLQDKITEPMERIPLLVGLAEPDRPGGGASLADEIVELMVGKVGARFHPRLSRTIAKGHTSGFEGLRIARELFKNPEVSICVVCGVDSYINASSLLWLDRHQRLKTVDNSDGVIPGEGAAAVLVRRRDYSKGDPTVEVMGLGFAQEKATVMNEEPLLGLGLAEAARAALAEAGLQYHQIDFRISDVTGESYGFKEQSLALSRVLRQGPSQLPLWHCADNIGDVGAAMGVCQWIKAAYAFRKIYTQGVSAICSGSSVAGERATAVLGWQLYESLE